MTEFQRSLKQQPIGFVLRFELWFGLSVDLQLVLGVEKLLG